MRFEFNEELVPVSTTALVTTRSTDLPRNWLWIGAPGTGKSFNLNEKAVDFITSNSGTVATDLIELTFHPSTSYFDFIGDYRPLTLYDPTAVPSYVGLDGSSNPRPGSIAIDYSFVAGAFLQAFIRAIDNPTLKIVVLIDEINRGNIFEIMGEVLHIMERDEAGIGKNEVTLSDHAMAYLRATCADFTGMRLPENLYLWATMNPNDHSVHRIDSAFVRRWTTKYIGIDNGSRRGAFSVGSPINLDWSVLRDRINNALEINEFDEATMIGFWYLKDFEFAPWERFYSKLVFHLANNVVKHNLGILFRSDLNSVRKIMRRCAQNRNPFREEIVAPVVAPVAPVVAPLVAPLVAPVVAPPAPAAPAVPAPAAPPAAPMPATVPAAPMPAVAPAAPAPAPAPAAPAPPVAPVEENTNNSHNPLNSPWPDSDLS